MPWQVWDALGGGSIEFDAADLRSKPLDGHRDGGGVAATAALGWIVENSTIWNSDAVFFTYQCRQFTQTSLLAHFTRYWRVRPDRGSP
jgi:hypothetical protein